MIPTFPFIMLFLDFIYLSILQRRIRVKVNYIAVVVCYMIILFSYYYFIYLPKKSAKYAFIFGATVYGIYETTNLAIFEKWPLWLVIIDTFWGGVLYSFTVIISNYLKTNMYA